MSQLVPINITGQQYQSRAGQLSNQVTQNFYSELTEDPFGKAQYVLQPTPGMLLFGAAASGVDRGVLEHQGILYHVCGTKLYTVASNGTHTDRGTIAGTDQVIFTPLGSGIVIVANVGVNLYLWDGSTLAAINDGDLETPKSATTLNNQVIYQGDNGRFVTSDVGDSTTIDALNYATAESFPDDLVRVYAFNQQAYFFGEKTIEVWWNSGQGSPPFDRIEGGILQVGLNAKHSVASNDRRMYWLGDDLQVYALAAGSAQQPVSNIALHGLIASYATTSDAIGWVFTLEGQEFYVLTFPTQGVTWLFDEKTGWTTLSSGAAGGRSLANSYAYAFGKHIIGDYASANLYQWSPTVYTDNGTAIVRLRDTAPLHGGLFGAPGARIEQDDLRLIAQVGAGIEAYADLPGASGDYCSTPYASIYQILSPFDSTFEALISPDSWSTGSYCIAARDNAGSDPWRFELLSGILTLTTNASQVGAATVSTGFVDGSAHWVKCDLDGNNGSSNRVHKFYTSADGVTWTQIGATVTTSGAAGMGLGQDILEIGAYDAGTKNRFSGGIHRVRVYDGIDGTQIMNFNASDYVSGSTWTDSFNAATWTLNGNATIVAEQDGDIFLSISDDGGNTFSAEISASIGASSDFRREVRWNALGSFVDGRILRLRASDAVFYSLHGATSYIGVGI
jgi:hypothetical protein